MTAGTHRVRLSLALLILCSALQPANAQDAAPAKQNTVGKQVFRPDFFASFEPVTALDMVRRIPSFSIEGSGDRRGFGENASNVLIDGDRPSTKSDDIATLLSRIPASEVDTIELIEQAGADGEIQGRGQIVNVVRKAATKPSGTYSANVLIGTRYGVTSFGSGSMTLRRGPTSYMFNFSSFAERLRGFGPEDFRDGTARLSERRNYVGRGGYDEISLGGAIKTNSGNVKINANGKYTINNGADRRLGEYTDATGAVIGSERLFTDAPITDSAFELGGDLEFPLAARLNTKLIGLYRTRTESTDAFIETERTGTPIALFETRSRNRASEAVFRVQNDWTGLSGNAIQFGAELASNRLDAKFSARSGSNGAITAFPASNVEVRELRVEPFISDVWTISPRLTIEVGAIMEFSRLKLSGDSNAQRSFQFIKPRIIASWALSKATSLEFRITRQVAQLDFNEFATSVDLGQGNQVDAGNQDLVPEKLTDYAAIIRHKFLDRGSIQLLASYVDINDTQDLVLITTRDAMGNVTGRFDGAGNIGKSKRWNAELEITLPFDWLTQSLGVTGLELKYVGHYHGSSLTDPVTGLNRRVSGRPLWHQNWDLRHDIQGTGLVWGVSWAERASGNAYFFNQYRREDFGAKLSAFIEYNRFKLGTIKIEGMGLTGDKTFRNRFFYNDTRASNVLTQIINRTRTLDPRIQISLSGKF